MSKAFYGEHYCLAHQGNSSHYAAHNCKVCTLESELAATKQKLEVESEARHKAEADLSNAISSRTEELRFKNAEIADLCDKKFVKFNNEDCWIFQDDGNDELQTLICPVVIKPKRLIELLAAEQRIKESQEQEPDEQLCKFYSVSTYPELVKAMENHITRLQAKIPPIRDTQPGRVREG